MSIKRHQAGKLFSAAVEHGGLVYVAGQVADDLTQGVRGQTEQAPANRRFFPPTCGSPISATGTR